MQSINDTTITITKAIHKSENLPFMILGFLFTDNGSPPSPSMAGTDLAMIGCSKLIKNSLRNKT
jgi:hypothetical protein